MGFKPIGRTNGGWANAIDTRAPAAFTAHSVVPSSASKRSRIHIGPAEAAAESRAQADSIKQKARFSAIQHTALEFQQEKNEAEEALQAEKGLSHSYVCQIATLRDEIGALKQINKETREFADESHDHFIMMEECANEAVGNAKVSAEYVSLCVISCSDCLEACKVNNPKRAQEAANEAARNGELAFEAAKRAATVNNPSSSSQVAYDEAKEHGRADLERQMEDQN